MMAAKLKTAVLGATGYSGLELTRVLLHHPRVDTPVLLSRPSDSGSKAESDGIISRRSKLNGEGPRIDGGGCGG